MKMSQPWLGGVAAMLVTAWISGSMATPYEEELEDEDEQHIVRLVRDLGVSGQDTAFDRQTSETDLAFVDQMKRYHHGAVDMAETYLDDPRGRNPVLRRLANGVVANQEFEIAVLEDVKAKVAAGPRTVSDIGGARIVALDRGIDDLEHVWKFRNSPPPSLVDIWLSPGFVVSDFDVQFTRPMKEHHEAALQMARDYNSDSVADNLLLRRLNNEIVVDQRYEIRFIESVLARYPGDPRNVRDDPRMMEIMHQSMGDMMHGQGGDQDLPTH